MESILSYIKKPELFEELNRSQGNFFAVIDEKVRDHLPEWMKQSSGVFWIKHPEESKCIDMFSKAVGFFLEQGIDRQSTLHAIGGGATTDLAGFVAASVLRGIKWISIPTTLLAMVDGSIGGKVAINMPQGKNLLGAFHAPEVVYICHDFLITLPEEEWISGKGEVLKYAFLSEKIHDLILKKAELDMIALECAQFKKTIVDKDFKESGDRIFLNFGHTLGHAFESTLKIPHGIAVGMGIHYLLKVMKQVQQVEKLQQLCLALNFPLTKITLSSYQGFSVDKFKNYLTQDKKKLSDSVRLVLIKEIGKPYIQEMKLSDLTKKIEGSGEF